MLKNQQNENVPRVQIFEKLQKISNSLGTEFETKQLNSLKLRILENQSNSTIVKSKQSSSIFINNSGLTGYSKIQELKLVKIGLASSEQMRDWAEKTLPNGKVFGEVLNPNTLHYKTFKPHKGGLFCERIFGPLKDFECACGTKNKPLTHEDSMQSLLETKKQKRIFCSICDVEYTWSVIRRYQLGYIRLISPVSHLWYLKNNPSYLSLLLDIKKRDLESIIYCMKIITLEYYWKPIYSFQMNLTPSNLVSSYKKFLKIQSSEFIEKNSKTKSKKQKKEIQKRRLLKETLKQEKEKLTLNINPEERIREINQGSLQIKIVHLEKSFELSSPKDYSAQNMKKRNRNSKVLKFLQEKVLNSFKKQTFFTIYKHLAYTFYQDLYISLTVQNSANFNKFINTNHLSNIQVKDSFSTIPRLIKPFIFLNNVQQTDLIKANFLDNKLIRETLSIENLGYNNQTYVFTNFKPILDFSSTSQNSILIEKTSNQDNKKRFLKDLASFISKSKIKETWNSIYQSTDKVEILISPVEFFKKEDVKKKTLNNTDFNSFLKNILFLYLLFVIQSSNKIELDSDLNSTMDEVFEIMHQNSKDDKYFGKIPEFTLSKLMFGQNQEFFDLEIADSISENLLQFIQSDKILEITNKKFTGFYNLFLDGIHKNAPILFCKNIQNHYIQIPEYKRTFLFSEEIGESDSVTKLASKMCSHTLLLQNTDLFGLEEFYKNKKVNQFLGNSPVYISNSMLYVKNQFTRLNQLIESKNKKTLNVYNLFNNIYTVSYLKDWDSDKDWKYFLYYNTAPIDMSDGLILNYRSRFLSNSFFNSSSTNPIPMIGANLVQQLLFQYEGFEFKKMGQQLQNLLPKLNRAIRIQGQFAKKKTDFIQQQKLLQKRDEVIRRLKLFRKLFKKNVKTRAMILNTLPVLPPDLRPILKMQNQIAASDLNRFYQRILYRNDRLKKFLRTSSAMINYEPGFEIKYAQRLLQEAVDNLIQNGKGNVKAETNSRGQPLKSLSEILKGKQGRFRQYLLGKRVDYSGRSVIVVGPKLKIYECGLPFEMAMELFLPFLIKKIFQYKFARTVIGAKTILKTQTQLTWELLEEVMQNHPILLNRAPTLHRLGIQAFQPKLIEGRAILLHPLVCPAFNADFDGDQMAVHVPITVEARTEAWKLMFSRNHLVSPATGEPMLLPSQDMVLGCYYLTAESFQYSKFHKARPFQSGTEFYFLNMKQILQAYLQEKIHLQTPIWIRWNGNLQTDQQFTAPTEIRLENDGSWFEIRSKLQRKLDANGNTVNLFIRTTAGRIIFNTLIENCIQRN